MSPFVARYLGSGLPAHLANAALVSVQVLICLIVLSPLLYRFSIGKQEAWLLPWDWMTPTIAGRLCVVGLIMTLCFGVGAWVIAHHSPTASKRNPPE